jgi:hypothetical protein
VARMTSTDDLARVMWQLTERTTGDVVDDWIVRQSTGGSTGSNQMLTRGTVRAYGWVPRGPISGSISGCHVAPRVLPIWPMSKIIGVVGNRTHDLLHWQRLNNASVTTTPYFGSCYVYVPTFI